jgi:hypothetical protein
MQLTPFALLGILGEQISRLICPKVGGLGALVFLGGLTKLVSALL